MKVALSTVVDFVIMKIKALNSFDTSENVYHSIRGVSLRP